jgi:hypothetical protein
MGAQRPPERVFGAPAGGLDGFHRGRNTVGQILSTFPQFVRASARRVTAGSG